MNIYKAYKTEIDPNNRQRTLCLKSAGTARFVYNWGLKQKNKARQLGLKCPNYIELQRQFNSLKQIEFPWVYEVSKCCPQCALRNLDRAFANFFKKCKLKKEGKFKGKAGYPKPKTRKRGVGSFRLDGTIKVHDNYIELPRIGKVRLKEKGYIPAKDVKIISATISEKAGKWFVSVLIEEEQKNYNNKKDDHDVVGVDLGIKTLATVSDGEVHENPKPLKMNQRKLRTLQKSVSRKEKGSKNRKKAVNKLARKHQDIANIRKDKLHKVTTALAKTKRIVGIEDLNIAGMMKNRKLAKAIADVGFGEFKRQLLYKAKLYNCQIVLVDRWFPSSKMCSICQSINDKLELKNREWICEGCGTHHDRDFNASVNIEREALRIVAASLSETENACGESSAGLSCHDLNETIFDEAGMEQRV